MTRIKNFFGIEKSFTFEIADLTTFITILNVAFIITGFWWAPLFGIANCVIGIVINIKNKLHINMYIMQIALLILNFYFLIAF